MKKRLSQLLDQIIAAGLVGTLIFTALAHGAVEPWSVALCSWLIIAMVAAWAIKMIVDGRFELHAPLVVAPIIALLLLGVAQSIALGGAERRSLSLDVDATRKVVLLLGLWLAAFLIAANFLKGRKRLKNLSWFLACYGLAMAVFALVQHFTWNGMFYWIRPMGDLTSPFGPFINHNLFAGHMELLAFIPAGMALAGGVRGPARFFFVFASAVMSLSIVLSLSRGGTISLMAGMVFLALMGGMVRNRGKWDEDEEGNGERARQRNGSLIFRMRSIIVVVMMVGVIALGLLWLGPESVIDRATQGQLTGDNSKPQAQTFFVNRGWIWKDTWAMIRANPILGIGLGAYEAAYPIYSASDGSQKVSEAHNDYLQILADGGIIGALLALWFIWKVSRMIFRGLQSQDRLLGSIALGSGAAIFAMLVHSFFDFNLQLPSNALLFLLHSAVVSNIGAVSVESSATEVGMEFSRAKASAVSASKVVSS
jgi:O-antigen ligase